MSLYTSKGVEEIASVDDSLVVLTRRKHWSLIPHDILQRVLENADGDIARVRRSVAV